MAQSELKIAHWVSVDCGSVLVKITDGPVIIFQESFGLRWLHTTLPGQLSDEVEKVAKQIEPIDINAAQLWRQYWLKNWETIKEFYWRI